MNINFPMRGLGILCAGVALTMTTLNGAYADDDRDSAISQSQVQRGFQLSPVAPNVTRKNRDLVGLGSYIVNTTGCNDCHTHPSYVPGHDPFLGQSEQVNAAQFLTGGRQFGPFITSANLRPDADGNPAGLTLAEFMETLRTGHNPNDPPGVLLQVMPWPVFGKKTDRDLRAIYEYLSALPSLPDNPAPGP